MDSITQAALGAVVGQSVAARSLGRRALVFGVVAGTLPDLDGVVINLFDGDAFDQWVHHRGITHSLFFGPVVGTLLGHITWRYYAWRDRRRVARGKTPLGLGDADKRWSWTILWVLALFTHALLDALTTYGTQLLAPFSDYRFAFDAMSIVDPVYTIPLLLAVVVGLLPWRQLHRKMAVAMLVLSTAYIGYCSWLKLSAEAYAADQLANEGVTYSRLDAHATLFQGAYRRIVVQQSAGYLVGYYTRWAPGPIQWRHYPQGDHPAIGVVEQTREGRIADWFASEKNYKFVRADGAGGYEVIFRDMRYGLPVERDEGLFGLRAMVGRDLNLQGSPQQTRPGSALRRDRVGALFRRMYGLAFPQT
ncbi:MAG: hypothetical protein CMF31_07290 [Kordiimonas sp.]|nr:hypothetical protein [Kordiimonas sp.]